MFVVAWIASPKRDDVCGGTTTSRTLRTLYGLHTTGCILVMAFDRVTGIEVWWRKFDDLPLELCLT